MADEKIILRRMSVSVNIDEKLGYVTYKADHSHAHLKLKDDSANSPCATKCKDKPCLTVCPARVYVWEEAQKRIIASYENCLECGAAPILCPFDNIAFEWPRGGFGVKYKMG
jgi:ferredoxin like protein